MNLFFQHLNSPEYMHVLLNPIPVYGLAIGVAGLLLAVIARSRPAIVVGLMLVFLSVGCRRSQLITMEKPRMIE